jgi:hypothetical protein
MICGIWILAALFVGCNDASPPERALDKDTPDVGAISPPDATTPGGEVPLKIASWDDTQAMIAQQRGKIVVVDLWTTW